MIINGVTVDKQKLTQDQKNHLKEGLATFKEELEAEFPDGCKLELYEGPDYIVLYLQNVKNQNIIVSAILYSGQENFDVRETPFGEKGIAKFHLRDCNTWEELKNILRSTFKAYIYLTR